MRGSHLLTMWCSAWVAVAPSWAFQHSSISSLATPKRDIFSLRTPSFQTRPTTAATSHKVGSIPRKATALQASPLEAVVTSPLGALAVLSAIVVVHESGHYLAARSFGMKVEEFSVGFGPKLLGFTALGNDFNFRAFPLGGYVRFPENYNATLVEETRKKLYEEAVEDKKKKSIPTLSERIKNALTFGSLAKEEARRNKEALEAYEQLPWWRKVQKVQAKKAEERVTVPDVEIEYDENPNLIQNRPWTQRAVVLSGGVIFNIVLSFSIYFGEIFFSTGLPSPVFAPGVRVGAIPRDTAAAKNILQPGDVILGVNGMKLTSSTAPSMFEAQNAMNSLIAEIRATPDGGNVELSVQRGRKTSNPDDWQPDSVQIIAIKPKRSGAEAMGSGGTGIGPQTIGVLLTPNMVESRMLKSDNPAKAAILAWEYTSTLMTETFRGITTFIGQSINPPSSNGAGGGGGGEISGPIGLIRTGTEVLATRDITAVLLFAAAISINLGVLNALPLPALDGGQLVFVLAEGLTGRKLDQRLEEAINSLAALFLIFVSLTAAFGDLSQIFGQ